MPISASVLQRESKKQRNQRSVTREMGHIPDRAASGPMTLSIATCWRLPTWPAIRDATRQDMGPMTVCRQLADNERQTEKQFKINYYCQFVSSSSLK